MNTKRIAAGLLAVCMALSLSACGGKGASSGSMAGTSGTSVAQGERPTIKWLTTGDGSAKAINSDDRIVAEIEDRLGINLEIVIAPENNTEKINVQMASGDFPDVVTGAYGTAATQQWIDNGMVIPLNDYFSSNPDMKAWCENDYAWTAADGQYYGVPFITQYNAANNLIVMRRDWLDNLGLSYPTTLDEMKEVLNAFTYDDPDGNGKNDTYGYTAEKPNSTTGVTSFDWVFFGYGLPYADYALDADGNVIPWFEDASFVPAMNYIKDLWDSGVVDSELMLNDGTKREEKFYQGRAGAMQAPMYRHASRHENSLRQVFPEASIAYGLPPAGPDGSMGLNKQGKDGFLTCITAACKAPDKAAAFINFMISEEGNDLLRNGIEGIHYTKGADGSIQYNEEERAKDAFADNGWAHALAFGSFYWPLESGYMPETETDRVRALETVELATQAQKPNLIKNKSQAEIASGKALNDIVIQYFSDMLQGKITVENGVRELSEKWRSQGGEEVLAQANELYKAQNQ